eukprot:CAMPEP_0174818140 /NCGR_PEP_ID=MMETSP1107-20130205/764_1 /TAXON_ID=36770 /ORGANISM="Paraphysomonas vestita, Strain GFlagA" /LENGTH=617 /DNA_ID=CAMNT_0016029599 /DNA_START=131 /DNA_END=1984 /DNA_ORIENTATION=+
MTSLTEDGWNGVKLFVEFPDGSTGSDAPDRDHNPIERDICIPSDNSGIFYITAAVEDPTIIPRNTWGVFWTVEICKGNATEIFTGGYNSTFIFSFDPNSQEWSLIYHENLLPNDKHCDACGETNECERNNDDGPNPKPKLRRRKRRDDDDKKRRKRDDDRKKPNPKNDDNNDDNNNNSTNTTRRYLDDHSTNTSVISAPTVSYNKPYVDARITMFDQEGDGWWFNDYLGISWYLADSTRTKLFHTGSLCNGTSGFCNLCLADGDYTLRVSGLKSTFLSWDFCGVRGSYGEELVFEVQDNKCYPIALLDLANSSSQVITYVFESTLEVCLKEEYLNLTDPKAVATITNTLIEVLNVDGASVIIEEVKDNDDNNNNNNKPSLPSTPTKSRRGSNSNHGEKKRRSKNDHDDKPSKGGDNDVDEPEVEVVYNHNIKFTITIKVQTDELHVDEVLDTYEKLLAESISNGTFISKLVSNSLVYGYTPFNFTSCAKSSEFTYVSAHFDFSLPFISSTLLFTPGLNSHIEASAIHNDYSAISLFFGSIVVGFIAFVGIVSKGLNGYNTLSNDSQHDIEFSSTHSTSSHGLLPFSNAIDMDQTISNPLGANAAREVQREQHVRSSL